jgi:hypothetical protein
MKFAVLFFLLSVGMGPCLLRCGAGLHPSATAIEEQVR